VNNPNAVLLYQIKNARKIKDARDDLTKYDFGATAEGTDVLRIKLEAGAQGEDGLYAEPDLDRFIECLASPVLVPIRSDAVSKLTDWAASNGTVLSNGPFYLKSFNYKELTSPNSESKIIRLERNKYYRRNLETDPVDTYVKPYGITINLDTRGTDYSSAAAMALAEYGSGVRQFISYLPLDQREAYKDAVDRYDSLFTHSYYFNTKDGIFANKAVRQALSLAIDRTALVNELVFAKPATSIVNGPITGTNTETFVASSADLPKAKQLLQGVSLESKSFNITVKKGDEVALKVAKFCENVWEKELGFSVTVQELGAVAYQENYYDGVHDMYTQCLDANGEDATFVHEYQKTNKDGKPVYMDPEGKEVIEYVDGCVPVMIRDLYTAEGFDIIAVDLCQSTTDPFTVLAPFSKYFSGGSLDLSQEIKEYEPILPTTSYNNDAYDALIEAAFATTDETVRAEKLAEAEKLLMEELPVMPLFTFESVSMLSSKVKKVTVGFGGSMNFANARFKSYVDPDTTAKKEEEEV
jgi:ABC-type oligopeptide transport system substrate-binding subunit